MRMFVCITLMIVGSYVLEFLTRLEIDIEPTPLVYAALTLAFAVAVIQDVVEILHKIRKKDKQDG